MVRDICSRRIHGEHRVAMILDDIIVIAGAGHSLRHLALQLTSLGINALSFQVRRFREIGIFKNDREKKTINQ